MPGLPEAAAREGLTPLEYMRKYGVVRLGAYAARVYYDRARGSRWSAATQRVTAATLAPTTNIVPMPAPGDARLGAEV